MNKLEIAKNRIQWRIETQQQTIEEMRESIKNTIDSQHIEHDVDFILSYANRMKEAADKLRDLHETMRMLDFIGQEDVK